MVRSAEFDVTFDSTGNYVTSKTVCTQVSYLYNADGEMAKKIIRDANGDEQIYKYTNPEGSNPVVTLPTGVVSQSKNDKFGRKEFDELQLGRAFMYRRFTYHDGSITGRNRLSENLKSTPTTNLVKEITLENGRTLAYEYDAEERITRVTDSVDGVTEYTYDAQGQLLTEKVTPVDSTQVTRNTVMTYDRYGNIQTKTTNGVTNTYEYNCTWKDKLTAVNGVPIVYDNLGNPISYLGHNLTWEKGRQLKKFTKADGTVIQYTYNANGIRTSKTVGGVKHTYLLDGTKILKETWGDCTLIPLYDNEDSVCGIIYDDAAYYFHKNLQGDVIEIKNAYGVCVARYTYDAWGRVVAITDSNGFDVSNNAAHVANANPFRYRGYYYDAEIGMYYLQSRYYDPNVNRFFNADGCELISLEYNSESTNLFIYCHNDPINNIDITGDVIFTTIVKCVLGAIFGLLVQLVSDLIEYAVNKYILKRSVADEFAPSSPVGDYVGSAVAWALNTLSPVSKAAKIIVPIIPVGVKHITNLLCNKFKLRDCLIDLGYALLAGIISVALTNSTSKKLDQLRKHGKKNSRNLDLKAKKRE